MRAAHTRDEKNRIRLEKNLKDNQMDCIKKELRAIFFTEYFIICGKEKFESLIAKISKEEGNTDEVRAILESYSLVYKTDNQGRWKIPNEFLTGSFEEKEYIAIGIKAPNDNAKENYIKVYPKTIYEQKAREGIKKFEEILKGEGDEERRRKD